MLTAKFFKFYCKQNRNEQLPDVFEGWEELTLVIESLSKEISDTFDISVKIPINNIWTKEH